MNWPVIQLDQVARIERATLKPQNIADGSLYVGLEHVTSTGTFTDVSPVSEGELASSKFSFTDSHILYGKLRPYLSKIAAPSFTGICSTEIIPILPGPEIDKQYLFHFLRQPTQINIATARSTGANLPRLNPKELAKFKIPLPPLQEQRRLAAILDQTLAIRSTQIRQLGALNALGRSLYQKVVSSSDSGESPLGEIADITSGITKGRRTSLPTQPLPYLAVANVQEGRLDLDNVKEIEATKSEAEKYRLKPGDLVLTEGGDPDKLGRGTVWRNELPICLHQNHIFRVRLHDNANNLPDFVSAAISSDSSKRYFLRSAKQTTGIASINMTQLRNLRIPLPAADVQQRFVADIERISLLRESYKKSLIEADALFSSVQSRAFRGEL